MADGFLGTLGEPDEEQVEKARRAREDAARLAKEQAREAAARAAISDSPAYRALSPLRHWELAVFVILVGLITRSINLIRADWIRSGADMRDAAMQLTMGVGVAAFFMSLLLAYRSDWVNRRPAAVYCGFASSAAVVFAIQFSPQAPVLTALFLGLGSAGALRLLQAAVADRSSGANMPVNVAITALAVFFVSQTIADHGIGIGIPRQADMWMTAAGILLCGLIVGVSMILRRRDKTGDLIGIDEISPGERVGLVLHTLRVNFRFYGAVVVAGALVYGVFLTAFYLQQVAAARMSGELFRYGTAGLTVFMPIIVGIAARYRILAGHENASASLSFYLTAATAAAYLAMTLLTDGSGVELAMMAAASLASAGVNFLVVISLLAASPPRLRAQVLVLTMGAMGVLAIGVNFVLFDLVLSPRPMKLNQLAVTGLIATIPAAVLFRVAAKHFPNNRLREIVGTFE